MLPLAERVSFPSADGATTLIGYLFKPATRPAGQAPAVVMMHGRGGAYSSLANGDYRAETISRRHQEWGHLWVRQGYVALLVDGFGPRGYPQGFPRFSYDHRPKELDEVSVRPLDAYGALIFLRSRADVARDKIVLQGWSNGASAALVSMTAQEMPELGRLTPANGFRAALAFYPACGLRGRFGDGLVPYGPMRIYHGSADQEVSPRRCEELVSLSRRRGADIEIILYAGAEHGFDDPGTRRQAEAANAAAKAHATANALAFIAAAVR
jgi:dienelactone hydrolase